MNLGVITVSVIIPAYNAEKWIAATLESVIAQTELVIEVLVIDDGSTDATAAIVSRFPQVRYLRKANGGQASARNLGIQNARGEFIAFIDADDVWFQGKLRAQTALMRAENWAWCYCDGVACDQELNKILYTFSKVQAMYHGYVLEKLLLGNFIPSPSPLVLRSVFSRVGLFNEDPVLKNREDWEMWLRIAEHYPVGYLAESYFAYRLHAENGTRTEDHAKALSSKLRVISDAVSRNPSKLEPLAEQARSKQTINSAKAALRGANKLMARIIVGKLLAEQPANLSAYALWIMSYISDGFLRNLFVFRNIIRIRSGKMQGRHLQKFGQQ